MVPLSSSLSRQNKGSGVPCDPARARALYDEAHEAGSPAAAYFMGHRFHVGDEMLGIEADGGRALQLLRRASEQVHTHTRFQTMVHQEPLIIEPYSSYDTNGQTPLS